MKYSDDFNPVDDLFNKNNSNQNNSLNTFASNTQNTDSVIQENNESWQNNNVTNTNYNQSIIKDNMINNENINNDIKIVNHNEEEATAEKIEVKEPKKKTKKEKELEDTIEFEKLTTDEESADSILNNIKDAPLEDIDNDIFNLIDSMYDEEDK